MHWTKLISSEVYFLKGRVIQDIYRAPIIYQHSSNCIVSDKQGDDDGIVMGMMYPRGRCILAAFSSIKVMAYSSVVLVLGDRPKSWTFCTTFKYVFLNLG